MADPRFYYYPESGGTLETIDLAGPLSDLQETELRDVEDAYDGERVLYRQVLGGGYRVRIVLERFTSQALERKLKTMSAHLERGGYIGFSRDHAKTWAGFGASGYTYRGRSIFYSTVNQFGAWNGSATFASGDECTIESGNPEMYREYNTVSSINASNQVTLGNALVYTYSNPVLLRWRDFYPALRLPADKVGKALVTHDHRISWTLDVELEWDLAGLVAAVRRIWDLNLGGAPTSMGSFALADTTPARANGKSTLDDLFGNSPGVGRLHGYRVEPRWKRLLSGGKVTP